ncbi:hypothetical protein NP493_2872g00003 [Ridgeia piscesae]|uniref:Uncharacterized protein n=1 Tax=Ridgeia piscesae TaxID=27915 RepID=A0AAD9MYC1_RIDPI|nr:hypothetical protein NP493_2872g00003 [Ridgeia piscesae]
MALFGPDSLMLPHRIWKVKFIGESVDDCGGGYSESIAEMCDELQNGSVALLWRLPMAVTSRAPAATATCSTPPCTVTSARTCSASSVSHALVITS